MSYITKRTNYFSETISPKSITEKNSDYIKNEILKSARTGLIDNHENSNLALVPKLLINDYSKGNKVLNDLISELNKCNEFYISVAFITSSGIVPLIETLKSLEKRNIKGKILTTDYLNFSEPKALKSFFSFQI